MDAAGQRAGNGERWREWIARRNICHSHSPGVEYQAVCRGHLDFVGEVGHIHDLSLVLDVESVRTHYICRGYPCGAFKDSDRLEAGFGRFDGQAERRRIPANDEKVYVNVSHQASIPADTEPAGTMVAVTTAVPKLRKANKRTAPGLSFERSYWQRGTEVVVGVDEVGRGAWAGPISVGAAIVPKDRRVYKIRDSKMLTEEEREALFDRIADWCVDWSVGHASHQECDELGMSAAQKLAATRAIHNLSLPVGAVLVDGNWDFVEAPETQKIVRGDRISLSIAAASILAKVTRDRMLRAEAEHYPAYQFEANKGYPCPRHKAALKALGPSTIHRRSWAFMDNLPWTAIPRYVRPDPQQRLFDSTWV